MPSPLPNTSFPRLHMVDVLRGVALIAMIIFHASWNLDVFGFAQLGVTSETGWIWFARSIAGSFIFLAGLSLVLAEYAGQGSKPKIKRICKITAAAIAVSIATYVVFPDSFVYFGILHHLALASLLAWPLVRVNSAILAALAVALVLINQAFAFEFADTRWLAWIGLSNEVPATNDYVPMLPWFSVCLAGLIVGKEGFRHARTRDVFAQNPRWAKPLIWMGKRSLIIYLLHQPILFGIAYGVFTLTR